MEKLGDILKKRKIQESISKENTDIWSTAEDVTEDKDEIPCPVCHGARFVHPLLSSGSPDYRKVVPCLCVNDELKKKKLVRLQEYSNLHSLSRLTFDNLLPEGRKVGEKPMATFKAAYEASRKFADSPKGWLIITGPNGCGKTHLACAIANYQISLSRPVFYIEVADLMDHLRSSLRPDTDIGYDELFQQIKTTPLLILDDLNLSVNSPWTREKIQQLLNHRFNEQMPTIITSSVSAEELDRDLDCHLTDPDLCQIFAIGYKSKSELEHFGGLDLELIKKMAFKNFDYKRMNLTEEEHKNLEQAYMVALNFAQSPQGWLVLLGDNGCGKTHLAASIANYLAENNKKVLFIVVPDFLDHLRSAFNPDSRLSYDETFEKVKQAPVLILDDFGEQAATPWTQEKLYQLINYRYNARLATVVTTCFSLDEIESRISSRMVDPSLSLVFNIIAPDYRGDRKVADKKLRGKISRKTDMRKTS